MSSFDFPYPIKTITNTPFVSGQLIPHNYVNELGENLKSLGNYVGNPATCNRYKLQSQILTPTSTKIFNWIPSLEFDSFDPESVFTLGSDSITVNRDGLYVVSFNLQVGKTNSTGSSFGLDMLVLARLLINGFTRIYRRLNVNIPNGQYFENSVSGTYTGYLTAGTIINLFAQDNGISTEVSQSNTTFSIARQG